MDKMAINEPDLENDGRPKSVFSWVFQDRSTGRIVFAQAPNLWLWIFLAALVASYLLKPLGPIHVIVKCIEFGSLAIWAADEVFRGVNPWRRFLGAITLGDVAFFLLNR